MIHPVIAHLGIPRSIHAHSQNLSCLLSCVCSVSSLLAIAARSSAYAVDEILTLDVPKVYVLFPCCSHLRRGSRNMHYKKTAFLVAFLENTYDFR